MLRIEPRGERTVLLAQLAYALRVGNHRVDFAAIADDRGVREQPLAVRLAIGGDAIDIEALIGAAECLALLQHREPGQASLVYFQHQTLEQLTIVAAGESVLLVVIRSVIRMPRCHVAIPIHPPLRMELMKAFRPAL